MGLKFLSLKIISEIKLKHNKKNRGNFPCLCANFRYFINISSGQSSLEAEFPIIDITPLKSEFIRNLQKCLVDW